MATKKQSAQTSVAEKPAKTSKPVNTVATAATKTVKTAPKTTAPKTAKAAEPAAPKALKAATTAVKKAVVKATAPVSASKKVVATAKVTFVLPKEAVENAETVAVLGDFNNWQGGIVLSKQKDGSYKTAIELEKGRTYEYRFLINGEKWENDWAAEAYAPTPFGTFNSVVTA